jgi:uncharacterized protein (DUF433 family)
VTWHQHIGPDAGTGTKPILRRTGQPIAEVLLELAASAAVDQFSAVHRLTSEELRACFAYLREVLPERMM